MPLSEETAASALTDEQALWQLWLNHRDSAIRSKLFFFYSQWSRLLASQMLSRYPHPLAEWPDYVSLASLGLLQAIDRFDASLPTRFQSYAEPYVTGAIIKGLSCYVRDRQQVTRDRLGSLSGEKQLGSNDDEFERVVNAAVDLAFGYFLELGIVNAEPIDNSPLKVYEQANRDQGLDLMVKRLPERERQVIVGHYYQFLSFVELAELMGISKSRVSQIHSQALQRVRSFYEAFGDKECYF